MQKRGIYKWKSKIVPKKTYEKLMKKKQNTKINRKYERKLKINTRINRKYEGKLKINTKTNEKKRTKTWKNKRG